MEFFIDSASLPHIQELSELGLIDGVTTNPSLIAKEGITSESALYDRYAEICQVAPANVSLEVLSSERDDMLHEAHRLAGISDKAVIKIAMSPTGLQVIRELSKKGIRTNCTLVFTPLQALLAAKAGATYVSLFAGRLDDVHADGIGIVADTKRILQHYSLPAKVLLASVRHVHHVLCAARQGIDIATCPHKVLIAMLEHPLTQKGIQLFLTDYHQAIS